MLNGHTATDFVCQASQEAESALVPRRGILPHASPQVTQIDSIATELLNMHPGYSGAIVSAGSAAVSQRKVQGGHQAGSVSLNLESDELVRPDEAHDLSQASYSRRDYHSGIDNHPNFDGNRLIEAVPKTLDEAGEYDPPNNPRVRDPQAEYVDQVQPAATPVTTSGKDAAFANPNFGRPTHNAAPRTPPATFEQRSMTGLFDRLASLLDQLERSQDLEHPDIVESVPDDQGTTKPDGPESMSSPTDISSSHQQNQPAQQTRAEPDLESDYTHQIGSFTCKGNHPADTDVANALESAIYYAQMSTTDDAVDPSCSVDLHYPTLVRSLENESLIGFFAGQSIVRNTHLTANGWCGSVGAMTNFVHSKMKLIGSGAFESAGELVRYVTNFYGTKLNAPTSTH